jgi:hypothetical protein
MKEEIAKNDYYDIYIDKSKNRLYYTVKGYWEDVSLVPENRNDLAKASAKLTEGFDILSDLTDMKPPPTEVAELHMKMQKMLIEKGLSKTAEVMDHAVLKIALQRYARESKMDVQAFGSVGEAEVWLDSFK